MRFRDIPQFYNPDSSGCTFAWGMIEETIANAQEYGLDLNPDFQREHVWDDARRTAFIEHALQDGPSGKHIYFNRGPWVKYKNPSRLYPHAEGYSNYVLVDGLQRITAVRKFLNNEIPAYGYYYREYEDGLHSYRHAFIAHYGELKSRADILKWYIQMNSTGVAHTQEELDRVRILLEQEQQNAKR
jgi:uncharacterized protein with ParB-like and HNH nuclease domain